ncbi:MAG: hypothetical protein ABIR31_05175 [Ginsengibacter sp.]
MNVSGKWKKPNRKFYYIFFVALLLIGAGWLVWHNYKYKIVGDKIKESVAKETDNIYKIKYDSLSFNEATGNAFIKNIHISADTSKIKSLNIEDMPYMLLDIKIKSINVTGVKTAKALAAGDLEGDSVVIDQPEIIIYTLKPVDKNTKIENEAGTLYKQILGNLTRIKLKYAFINNAQVNVLNFYGKDKNFNIQNIKIKLDDILIDSTHNRDTTRTLFCKQAAFVIDSFTTFHDNRRELIINDIDFSGQHKSILFNKIKLNVFGKNSADSLQALSANNLQFTGLNTNEFVKNKNVVIDSITCGEILLAPPGKTFFSGTKSSGGKKDTTGFFHVYSIRVNALNFPKINMAHEVVSKYKIGQVGVKINGVKAEQIIMLKDQPIEHSTEINLSLTSIGWQSDDKMYSYGMENMFVNSRSKLLRINHAFIKPALGETAFANSYKFQKDRYDLNLNGITLNGIKMEDVVNNKLIAEKLIVNKTVAKISRDINKPLEEKNKVGNYPSQLIQKIDFPIYIRSGLLSNAFIQYREHEKVSDSTGEITFTNTTLKLSNITNMAEQKKINNLFTINYNARALGQIPINGNFKFFLDNNKGAFIADGNISSFDARVLNKVSIPMALIRIQKGNITSINFNFNGNDVQNNGDFVMKYSDLKVDVLKRDEKTKDIKKRGLFSLVANILVKNSNPKNGSLRKTNPSYERNIHKSFFNLVWKTIFNGMKETVGLP